MTTSRPRLVLVLSENWTLVGPRDLRLLVDIAVGAEQAGWDGVMVSEHVVLGRGADEDGLMPNPREYALPGNQDPATPWPSSLVLLAAIAARTTTLRLIASAIIAPLRHPLLLARELGTLDVLSEGRLVVQPTVSWHRAEYHALGVEFGRRGRMLDEHLEAWTILWRDSPASFSGAHYSFDEIWLEPKAWRPDGPRLWFGGASVHDALLRRLVHHGHGFNPLGRPSDEDMRKLEEGLEAAGRTLAELELVGGTRARFAAADAVADLAEALASIPEQMEQGFGTFCIKPSQFTDDADVLAHWCEDVVARVARL